MRDDMGTFRVSVEIEKPARIARHRARQQAAFSPGRRHRPCSIDRRCDPPSRRDPNLGRGGVCGARRPDSAGRTLVGRPESAYWPGQQAA